ncbi:MAG: cyclic nucleotide-binding domain-containing protein [Aestuariivirga sp.]
MESYFNAVDLPEHLAYVIIAISYFLTNIYWLRVAAVIGLSLEIIYFRLTGLGTTTGLPWDVVLILINLYELFWLTREKLLARLPDADAAMLRNAFGGLDDAQIAKLLKAAEWKTYKPGDVLTRQDAPVDALYYVCTGRANVDVDGKSVAYLESGSFVGEIAYLTGNVATARVTIVEEARTLVFSKMGMAKVMASDRQISGIMYQLLGRDLAAKMRRANTRRFFTGDDDVLRA